MNSYLDEWAKDAPFDLADLANAARNVPILHAKWWRFYHTERLRHRQLDLQYKTLYNNKYKWYDGKLIDEDRLKLGWAPNSVKLLSAAIPRHLEADPDIQAMMKNKIVCEEHLKLLEDVIKQINGRGFHISNAVNFLKFQMGV